MCEQLLIYQKTYDLVLWLYPLINRLPKSHKHILGKEIEQLAIKLLLDILNANKARGSQRTVLQLKVSEDLDSVRILVRLCKDLKLISIKQYTTAAEKINEIGRILHGWIKANTSSTINCGEGAKTR